jgi:putative iron-regulated protein
MKNMKQIKTYTIAALFTALAFTACKKDSNNVDNNDELQAEILSNAATTVCTDSYVDMYAKSQQLLTAVNTLSTTTADANLESCKILWKSIRNTWEQTEAWLFGPVSSDNIDPRIDTWPVDFNALENILAGSDELNETYVDGLDDALKGFHPIEYLLWGQDGSKTAADFTEREKEYLLGLAGNLDKLCKAVSESWSNGYATQLATAGSGSVTYTTKKSAYAEIVDAMTGICDEVANGKMKDPFDQQDPTQEESPFAKNSLIDFANNIRGIMAMYQGKFSADGKGIEDLVRTYNLSLDNEIKTAHATALASLEAISVPFGEAILTQQTQVQNAMDKINALATLLDTDLKDFILQYTQ